VALTSPSLVGVSSRSSPYELEYMVDEEYTVPLVGNTSPIPVPAPSIQTVMPSDSDMDVEWVGLYQS
jgi:hypothetical protein